MRLTEIKPVFVDAMPPVLEEGNIYISEKFEVAIHLCACGCGEKTVMPINHKPLRDHGWNLTKDGDLVTFEPSIGNFIGEQPSYHAHYYIRKNKIEWV